MLLPFWFCQLYLSASTSSWHTSRRILDPDLHAECFNLVYILKFVPRYCLLQLREHVFIRNATLHLWECPRPATQSGISAQTVRICLWERYLHARCPYRDTDPDNWREWVTVHLHLCWCWECHPEARCQTIHPSQSSWMPPCGMLSGSSICSSSSMACILASSLWCMDQCVWQHVPAPTNIQKFYIAIAEPDQIYVKEMSHCYRQVVLTPDINVVVLFHNPHSFWGISEQGRHICILKLVEINR